MRVRVRVAWSDSSDALLMRLAGVSAVVHLVALILFSFMPRLFTPPPPPRTTIAEIIPASALMPAGGGPKEPPKGPTPRERAEVARRAAEEVKPPPKETPPPRDKTLPPLEKPKEKKPPERKPEPKPEPPMKEPAKPPAEETPPAEVPGNEDEPETGDADAGPQRSPDGISFGTGSVGGVPGIGSAAFPYDYYRSALRSILQSHWRRPVTPEGLAATVTCEVGFTILRTGIIQDARVVQPSGNAILDQSALRAVYDSNPLPPLPAQYGQASVAASVVFELTPE